MLGLALGTAAQTGRDKMTFVASPGLRSLGTWVKQLVAESTGKGGQGVIPVDGEALAAPDAYADDRLFVYMRDEAAPDATQDEACSRLGQAGFPVLWMSVRDRYALGGEFFRWEFATAVAGAVLGVNPFDQPDVEASKAETRRLKRFSNRPCTIWGGCGISARTDAGGPMRAYSMDLRERVLLDSDAGMKAADVAAKYRVSGSWVRLLKQRRRETGEVAPRVQRHGRRPMLEPHLHTLAALIAEQPDRTLVELQDGLGTPASLATSWRAVQALDITVKKNGAAVRARSA